MDIKKQSLNELADSLFSKINEEINKSSDGFFDGSLVVVPSKKMGSWIKAYWLKKQDNVMMNIDFVNLDKFLLSSFKIDKQISLASIDDYKNILIKLLSKNDYDNTSSEIRDYLFDNKDSGKVLNATKLYELASTLASLFSNYEKECIEITGWQKDYYDALINELGDELTTLKKLYDDKTEMEINSKIVHAFGFLQFDPLYEKLLKQYGDDNLIVYSMPLDDKPKTKKYEISSSPSITKEIEVVHSKICELLKDKKNGIQPTDFLVVGNNISEYENTIKKVFNQDDEKFAYIPYSISGSKGEDSNLNIVLNILLDIVNKGFFTRLDFYSLISNPLVQKVRNIDEEHIEQWMNCIYSLNVYRGKLNKDDDWDYFRKRVLLSKMSDVNFEDNVVSIEGNDYIPYSVIGLDNDSIVLLISILDNIKSWFETMESISFTDKDTLEKIREELQKWFCSEDGTDVDLRFRKASALIDYWINRNIVAPVNTFFMALRDITKIKSISYREPFVTGVTFMDFNENITYHQKHVFFINAGSSSLPKKIIKSELDLRPIVDNTKERNAFLYQYQNADQFHISFIGMDLKKDAELFESTLSKELRKTINPQAGGLNDEDYEKIINDEIFKYTIDEMREWDKLYTRGEYNKKDYREGLSSLTAKTVVAPASPLDPDGEIQERRKKISTGDISKYLEEPLSFKAKYLFGQADNEDKLNHEEFEPFSLDTLEESIVVSKVCELQANYIKNGQTTDFDFDEYKKQLLLENKLPRLGEEFSDFSFEDTEKKANGVIESIGIMNNPQAYELVKLLDLLMNNKGEEWVLTSNKTFVRREENNELHYYELKIAAKGLHKVLSLYACALMDVASRDNTTDYTVVLHGRENHNCVLNSARAKELLNMIFEAINDYSDNFFSYLEFREKEIEKFNKLLTFIGDEDNGKWSYFPYTKLFNLEDQIGFDKDDYKKEDYYKRVNKIIESIEYADPLEPEVIEDGGN